MESINNSFDHVFPGIQTFITHYWVVYSDDNHTLILKIIIPTVKFLKLESVEKAKTLT